LSTQVPFLGNTTFSLDVIQAALNAPAYLFIASSMAATPLSIGGGCFIYLDNTSLQAFVSAGRSPFGPVLTNAFGTASFLVPVPSDPLLTGLNAMFQAAVLDAGAPMGLNLSNGLTCLLN
jgi:hypothetical protein